MEAGYIFGSSKKAVRGERAKPNGKQKKLSVPANIPECEKLVKQIFGNSSDIVVKTFETVKETAMLVYVDGFVLLDLIQRDIISPLKSRSFDGNLALSLDAVFTVTDDMHIITENVLKGFTALFYGASGKAFLFEIRGWEHRTIEEPAGEATIRGPKEGFVENLRTNTAMIRRKIKTPELRFEEMSIGRQTRTSVVIVFINGIVNQEILEDLRARLKEISADEILETGQIEQLIEKNTFSPTSGMGITQKPDVLAQRILEGRAAVLVDGTPHALTVPEMFMDNFKTSDDYYNRTLYVNIGRILRGISLFITTVVPGLAIAVFTYDPEMLPPVFFMSIVSSSINSPMPFSFEILLLTVMFELIREGAARLPKMIGSTVTIIGSLIIGESAVSAGIVSAPSVIIVAMAALASFTLSALTGFIIVYRVFFWLLGSVMGVIGISVGLVIMITQIASEETFGRPILSSFSKNELKDMLLRFPLNMLKFRPTSIARENVRRKR